MIPDRPELPERKPTLHDGGGAIVFAALYVAAITVLIYILATHP